MAIYTYILSVETIISMRKAILESPFLKQLS